ncbi:MAG TPA: YeeE/YedE thiosulfate transporter family protein [Gemmatimonadales bacterium]
MSGGAVGVAGQLAIGAAIGAAFGVALERAGLGNARKLAGQFYLTDFTVFKVMFTAILTAMIGLFVLTRLGLMDRTQLEIPGTWVLPQLAGGILFGAGFIMGGLCPGTSCVAAASGRGDGVALIAGMFAGTLVFGELFGLIARFYQSTAMGSATLPGLLHLPEPLVVVLITAMALGCFTGLAKLERSKTR